MLANRRVTCFCCWVTSPRVVEAWLAGLARAQRAEARRRWWRGLWIVRAVRENVVAE